MTNIKRLDRLIVQLCHIRNVLTRFEQMDFDLDLHPIEAEVSTMFDTIDSQVKEIQNDNARD